MAKNKGGWFKWVAIVILLGASWAGWKYFSGKQKDKVPEYKTVAVSRGSIIQAVTASGQITPVKNVAVGSQVSGIILEVLVDFNSRVTNGQVVAQIDPSTYQQNISQADAVLDNSKAGLELAELNYKRAKELSESKLIAAAEYDTALVELHQAQASVKIQQAALNKTKVDLERATIYAPIDGIVISRNVDVGQTVAASFNTPTLFQIANDLSKMQIEAMVSEADVGGVAEGQTVNFNVDAFPNRQFHGVVQQVRYAPVTNQNVVNYTTVVSVNNKDLKLRPGMTATASIISAERPNILKIPNSALRFRPPEATAGGTNAANKKAMTTNSTASDSSSMKDLSPEERRKRFESMSPEEREQMRAKFAGKGGKSRSDADQPGPRTVYILDKSAASPDGKPVLKAVTIKVGIADNTTTEVIEGLNEGDLVVTGTTQASTETAAGGSSPFGSPFGGGSRMRTR